MTKEISELAHCSKNVYLLVGKMIEDDQYARANELRKSQMIIFLKLLHFIRFDCRIRLKATEQLFKKYPFLRE